MAIWRSLYPERPRIIARPAHDCLHIALVRERRVSREEVVAISRVRLVARLRLAERVMSFIIHAISTSNLFTSHTRLERRRIVAIS